MRHYIYTLSLLFICHLILNAQHVRPDDGYLFDDTVVPRIDVFVPQDSLDIMLTPGNFGSNHEYVSTCIIRKVEQIDTIHNVGLRLRGNTSRQASKKSFKLSFNTYEKGRKFKGVEKLNLNGEHNDPSLARANMTWDIFAELEVPSARVNHVRLFINNEYKGLYLNVEHIDEEFIKKRFVNKNGNLFKCLWPASLTYINSDPNSYKFTNNGRRAYDLKTNVEEDDYSGLADFILRLNSSINNNFQCKIEKVLDVNSVLKAMAIDMLTSNWDGVINQNNFYIYEDLKTGLFYWIPYDTDNTFGIDWFGIDWASVDIYDYVDRLGGDRPLYEQMLKLPEYKDRYTYYVEQIIENYYNNENLDPMLDEMRNRLTPFRIPDSYASKDYGFQIADFNNSYEDFSDSHVKYGLKEFIEKRRNRANQQMDDYDIVPIMKSLNFDHGIDFVSITADIIDDNAVDNAILHYSLDNQNWQEVELSLQSNGLYQNSVSISSPGVMQYYIRVSDDSNQSRNYPICGDAEINIGYRQTPSLVINEFMASNNESYPDENGEYDDWIEIYNADSESIELSQYYLSDNIENPNKWQMPEVTLAPDAYIVLWADEDGSQGDRHANFKLQKDGETIGIYDNEDNNFAPVDFIEFGAQETDVSFGRSPNGFGEFAVLDFISPNANNDINTDVIDLDRQVLNVYPNPTSDIIFVDSKYHGARYRIYNINGSLVMKGLYDIAIDINRLPTGIYQLEIIDGVDVMTEKIVVVE